MRTRQISNEEIVMASDGEHAFYDPIIEDQLVTRSGRALMYIVLFDVDDNSFWVALGRHTEGEPEFSDSYDYGGYITETPCPFE